MKYKVGDKVQVKSLEWYNMNKDEFERIRCNTVYFQPTMSKLCDSILTIKNIDKFINAYIVEENSYYWTDNMFEGLAEEVVCDKDNIDHLHELCQSKFSAVIIESDVFKDEVELILNGYEIEVRGDKTYAVKKKPKYPTTYEECAKVLGYNQVMPTDHILGYNGTLLSFFQQLLICRDAYWKIAGEQIGLGKSWEFENPAKHYVFTIEYSGGKILLNAAVDSMWNRLLVFPTKEMRDAFYKNFKDLIEKCKNFI